MANITLSELNAAGSQFFQDSESFLNDLSDVDAIATHGANGNSVSDFYGFNKLIEGFLDVYAIQHIFGIANSFSSKGGYGY
ncbi:hypothetical protein NIES2109_43080 [Nostoc sp. HK-01]|uniref:Uncharacterized protein n=2 Tax=Nostocales TaxID=1161 RepID=A0A1Z4GA25_9CYAN|nr:hypothetical protein [Nostoc cycadae]BAY14352.1 hypothetical protein NIES21_01090 [Anabaenopsis circularis NIES-21]BBD61480.1 hypothetical protein NIES2109_43080 [Nostoc sp. HK-01]GBE95031.1 hypothetical protein NCWK1_4813 [Nostoc cycadae WK-1]